MEEMLHTQTHMHTYTHTHKHTCAHTCAHTGACCVRWAPFETLPCLSAKIAPTVPSRARSPSLSFALSLALAFARALALALALSFSPVLLSLSALVPATERARACGR